MLFSSDWQILFVILSILKFSALNCNPWSENGTVSSMYATIGDRSYMEDFSIRIENDYGVGIFGVFDGHGGDFAAKYATRFFRKNIHNEIVNFANKRCEYKNDFIIIKLGELIAEVDDDLKEWFEEFEQDSGTTCLLVIAEERRLTVANLGDSRGVMCNFDGDAIDLSTDHKPDSKKEKKRIKEAGGSLEFFGVWRVKGLAISRSLGDHDTDLKKQFVSGEPDISTYDLDEYRPKFMILATDGVWDVISSQEAVNFIKSRYSSQEDFGARDLAKHAMKLKSEDNITVLIVKFNKNGHYEVGSASV